MISAAWPEILTPSIAPSVNLHIDVQFVEAKEKEVIILDGKELVKQTLDQMPQANVDAKRIVGLVKKQQNYWLSVV